MMKSNISDAYQVQRGMLRVTGVWPEKHTNRLYKLRGIVTWILSIGLCTTMWMEVLNDITDFVKLSEILYVTISGTVYIVKLYCLTFYSKTFISMIEHLDHAIFISYPEYIDHHMAKMIKLCVFLGKLYRYLCFCCMFLYAVYPVLDNKQLPFPFPYDLGRYRLLMYIFQVVSVNYVAWNASAMDILYTSFLGIGGAQLDTLAAKITDVLNKFPDICNNWKNAEQEVIQDLRQCVRHHLAIIKFINDIEKIFSLAFFSQFVGSTIIMCNTLFYFLLVSELSSLFILLTNYLIVIVVQLFMFCWFGNEIMVKSTKVGDACYTSKWYKHDKTVRKYLFLIMERSRRPLAVTLFKISELSVDAFKSIMQWSYSCFALLLKLYYED